MIYRKAPIKGKDYPKNYYFRIVRKSEKKFGAYDIELYKGDENGEKQYWCQSYMGFYNSRKDTWKLYPTRFGYRVFGYDNQSEVHEISAMFINDDRQEIKRQNEYLINSNRAYVTLPEEVDIEDYLNGVIEI